MSVQELLDEKLAYETELTEYCKVLQSRSDESKLEDLSELRKFSLDTIKECGIFYIDGMAEMLVPAFFEKIKSFGVISANNGKPIFSNRWVFPIKNKAGLVQNFVGYSNTGNERYIYSLGRYYRRKETLYGLENFKIAEELGYAIITEGITDTVRLRDMGYKNSFARCGTHASDTIDSQIARLKYGAIFIPDRDTAGEDAVERWKANRYAKLNINHQYKDIDEQCRVSQELVDITKGYIDSCIEWLVSDTQKVACNVHEEITVI